ncbi:MAG: DUF1801 domain-containing protein [Bacteroides sp.]|nr:DUF1801 domain-containing protein [Bacteroides sp.]
MVKASDEYYLYKEEPQKSCLMALRELILAQDPEITETLKWDIPCFCYGKRIFCYLSVELRTGDPYLLMVEGRYLAHPGLEAGGRKKMKIFRVKAGEDIPIESVEEMLREALGLYKNELLRAGKSR